MIRSHSRRKIIYHRTPLIARATYNVFIHCKVKFYVLPLSFLKKNGVSETIVEVNFKYNYTICVKESQSCDY